VAHRIRVVFLALVAVTVAGPALAAGAAAQAPTQSWAQPIVDVLLAGIGTILAALLARALAALGTWLQSRGLETRLLEAEYQQALAQQAVSAVEERAAALRLRAGTSVLAGAEKLEAAVTDLVARLPGLSRDRAQQLVHAALTQLGAGAGAHLAEMSGARPPAAPAPAAAAQVAQPAAAPRGAQDPLPGPAGC